MYTAFQRLTLRLLLLSLCFLPLLPAYAQENLLAKQYFNDGDYTKALIFYKKLVKKHPRRIDYAENLVTCYQQLERYPEAEEFLLKKTKNSYAPPTFFIELGYNYNLQDQIEQAIIYYDKAIQSIDINPSFGYRLGKQFQKHALLDYALRAYTRAMSLNPNLTYHFQLARIYGEQGDVEKMYQSYLNLIAEKSASRAEVLRHIEDFISEDPTMPNNILLRKVLLKNAQQTPNVLWNELLSWLFIHQKQHKKAFQQEKAIHKRTGIYTLQRLEHLGQITLKDKDYNNATAIFEYLIAQSTDPTTQLNAQLSLIQIALDDSSKKQEEAVAKKFQTLMVRYKTPSIAWPLYIAYANFLAFTQETPAPAIALLKAQLQRPVTSIISARLKLALGDILAYDQKFNQALLYFTQVQKSLKNDVLAQEARFKIAQTSFYKGDFKWALTQLKVLRGSVSQRMANDAMKLSLIITDNMQGDSIQTALKQYARADLLAYQNKTAAALDLLENLLHNHKGEAIEDEVLLRQAQLLERQKDYEKAKLNYKKIVAFHANGILADDAHFALAELYRTVLNQPEEAKSHYEILLYNYQDSYYVPQARMHFRQLRGDMLH